MLVLVKSERSKVELVVAEAALAATSVRVMEVLPVAGISWLAEAHVLRHVCVSVSFTLVLR